MAENWIDLSDLVGLLESEVAAVGFREGAQWKRREESVKDARL